MNYAPILIVDDDRDDRELLQEAWSELPYTNALIFFDSGEDVLKYLESDKPTPFIILCDINLPKMDGFALKKKLVENPAVNYSTIPFIFWSTAASEQQIRKSYDLAGNGFFIKENNFEDLKKSLIDIVEYWKKSRTPNENED